MREAHEPEGRRHSHTLFKPIIRVVLPAILLTQCVHPRPLARHEQAVEILPGDPATTRDLEQRCAPVETGHVHTVYADDMRRRAGEQGAQIVQDVRTESTEIPGYPYIKITGAELVAYGPDACDRSKAWTEHPIVLKSCWKYAATLDGQGVNLICERSGHPGELLCPTKVGNRAVTCRAKEAERELRRCTYDYQLPYAHDSTTGMDVRFWKCPASRATPAAGEIIWRTKLSTSGFLGMRAPPSYWEMQFIKDGQIVSRGEDAFAGLSQALAAYPLAAERGGFAESLARSAKRRQYTGATFALTFIAATGVGTAGYFLHDRRLLLGGAGGMLVSFPVFMILLPSGVNTGGESMTAAMEAADLYNDHVIQR